ncbi:hypothetical protein [Paraglaciecola sp. L3A3]|uniref:hypothetical protein n=1 Tax=Paraglaciecola sp. L3A3 TaxID=2686358 RepID=UPI001E533742|nr:hypothetical protein [Paraglaciecola sp. L3A3]
MQVRDSVIKNLILGSLLLSNIVNAKEQSTIFVKHELNADDKITGIGVSFLTQENHYSDFRGEAISSLNYAEVLDENDQVQNYISWDVGMRLGYYNDVFVYVEGGLDLLEMINGDINKDDDYYFEDVENGNGIDGYAALGAGVDLKKIKIEGFVKARKIDGNYWQSKHQLFYGAQFSLLF